MFLSLDLGDAPCCAPRRAPIVFALRALGLALSLVTVLVSASPAMTHAQDGGSDTQLLRMALAEYNRGHFPEALALFRRLHERSPSARTFRGVGMAAFEARAYVVALEALQAALTDERKPLTEDQRGQVKDLISRAETFVGRFRLEGLPEGATVQVGGLPAKVQSDGRIWMDVGTHSVHAVADGYEPGEVVVDVRGGEEADLQIPMRHVEETPEPVVSPAVVAAPVQASSGRGWYWAGAGLSAAVTAAGTVWWLNRQSEIDFCDAVNVLQACTNRSTLEMERGVAIGTTAVGALGLSIFFAAAVWPEDERDTAASNDGDIALQSCAVLGSSVSCTLSF